MRLILVAAVLTCVACSDEAQHDAFKRADPAVAPNPQKVTQKLVRDLKERLGRARETCENGPTRYDPDGTYAMAEVDVAMAANIDNVSPAQEQRIRASIGAEMGLAPSEVDGWRDIYRSRAEQAQRRLDSWERSAEESKHAACDNVMQLEAELKQALDSHR